MKKKRLSKLYSILGLNSPREGDIYDPSQKAIYHRKNFSAFLEGRDLDIHPVTVEVVPSLECNFNCPNCTYVQNKSKEKDRDKLRFMSEGVFNSIFDGLDEMRTKSIIFTGGGEPTLHPDYIDFMRRAKERDYKVGLYTNGSLLTEKQIREILDVEPSFVRVSLNAGTSDTHRKIYGHGKELGLFDQIVDNIINLGRIKAETDAKTTVGIGFIINEKNHLELEEIRKLLLHIYKETNGNIDYAAFRPEVYYFDDNLDIIEEQPNSDIFAEIPDYLKKEIMKGMERYDVDIIINGEGFEYLSKKVSPKPNIVTSWSASFDYDGKLYITSEHNGSPGFSMGNVKDKSVIDIWNGERRKILMEKMEKGKIDTPPYFKLKKMNDMFWKIRQLETFSQNEINSFYEDLNLAKPSKHVDFI